MQRAGTARADRHRNRQNPKAPDGRPRIPASLSPVARRAWLELVDVCDQLKIASTIDGLAVYQYAMLYEETEATAEARADLLRTIAELETVRLPTLTGPERSAAFQLLATLRKLERKCIDQLRQGRTALRQFLLEFGLTPASRNRIHVPTTEPEADPFATFQAQRPT